MFATFNPRLAELAEKYILFGDFNAKVGDFNEGYHPAEYSYPIGISNPRNPSDEIFKSICRVNKMVILNHLQTPDKLFEGGLTFRKKIGGYLKLINAYCLLPL